MDFSKRMRQIGKNLERNVAEHVKNIALATYEEAVLNTPAETGQTRARWSAGVGAAPPTSESAVESVATNTDAALARSAAIRKYKGKGNIVLMNQAPYIMRLNDGSDARSPANFVAKAIKAGTQVKVVGSLLGNK